MTLCKVYAMTYYDGPSVRETGARAIRNAVKTAISDWNLECEARDIKSAMVHPSPGPVRFGREWGDHGNEVAFIEVDGVTHLGNLAHRIQEEINIIHEPRTSGMSTKRLAFSVAFNATPGRHCAQ